jgi:hypothetical protein
MNPLNHVHDQVGLVYLDHVIAIITGLLFFTFFQTPDLIAEDIFIAAFEAPA